MKLAALPDRCPLCLSGPYTPYRTTLSRESVTGRYRCPCGARWLCDWLLSALREAEAA